MASGFREFVGQPKKKFRPRRGREDEIDHISSLTTPSDGKIEAEYVFHVGKDDDIVNCKTMRHGNT